ncbi:MAG: Sensory box histidine kinase [Pedobacter sp.]|jgi:PAS domain S-box-containing protein|nr:Sensory box histidine kinase [Pedobacter sp.]
MQSFEETKDLLHNSSLYYLISVDMNSNYSYVNNRYHSAFNGVHGNLVGQHYSITMHEDDLDVCRRVSEQCFTFPDRVFPAIIRKHDGKGGYIITQWEYKALFDADNKPSGVFCMGNDITEFMKASIDLKQTKESLIDAKLTLAQIAYIQSHVVRKPIANMLGLMVILETMDVPADLKSIISMMTDSAKEVDKAIQTMANPS